METILITGAGGYVGSELCEQLLAAGYRVRAMDNFYKGQCDALIPYVDSPNFEFIVGDVTNADDVTQALKGVDGVVHLAALVGFPRCKANRELAKLVNIGGTLTVAKTVSDLNRWRQDSPIKLLFASTGSVYGKVTDEICTENTALNAQSLYGETKIKGEQIIHNYVEHALVYRFATAFGVGHTTRVNLLINTLVYEAIVNRCLTIFEADAYRTFIHISDLASSFVFGLQNYWKMSHNLFNVGANHLNSTKRKLADTIAKRTGCYVTYAEVGKDEDTRDYIVSYDRWADTGWTAKVSIEQGIEELIKVTPMVRIRHQYD